MKQEPRPLQLRFLKRRVEFTKRFVDEVLPKMSKTKLCMKAIITRKRTIIEFEEESWGEWFRQIKRIKWEDLSVSVPKKQQDTKQKSMKIDNRNQDPLYENNYGKFEILAKSISHINFSSLKILNIRFALITNLEPLIFFSMQNLSELDLSRSQITSLKPLNKTNWLKLRQLDAAINPLTNIDITRAKMSSLKKLYLSPEQYCKHLHKSKDQKALVKIQTTNIRLAVTSQMQTPILSESTRLAINRKVKPDLSQFPIH